MNRVDVLKVLEARGLFGALYEDLLGIAPDQWNGKGECMLHCIFHEDRSPSMSLSRIKGVGWCFGCNVTPGVFNVTEKIHGLDREGAREWLLSWLQARGENVDEVGGTPQLQEPPKPPPDFTEKLKNAQANLEDETPFWAQDLLGEIGTSREAIISLGGGALPAWGNEKAGEPVRIIFPSHSQNGDLTGLKLREPWSETRKYKRNYAGSTNGIMGFRQLADKPQAPVIAASGPSDMAVLAKVFPEFSTIAPLCGEMSWAPEWGRAVQGRSITIWFDNNDPGVKGAQKASTALIEWVESVRVVQWPPGTPKDMDARQYIAEHGIEKARELIHAAKPVGGKVHSILSAAGIFKIRKGAASGEAVSAIMGLKELLEGSDPLIHAAVLADAKEALRERGITPTDAKNMLTGALGKAKEARAESVSAGAGQPFIFEDPEPWGEEVDGGALIEAMEALLTRYLVLPSGAPITLATWCLYTWAQDAFDVAVYICLRSPRPRCGKSNTVNLLSRLSYRSVPTVNTTVACLFRLLEDSHPTLLLDESDLTFGKGKGQRSEKAAELQQILNSGYKKAGAYVLRTIGDDHTPRKFMTYGAKVFSLIGSLPETMFDRCLDIQMQRKTEGERVARMYDRILTVECEDFPRKAFRWATDHREELLMSRPGELENVDDRRHEITEPLLAVADAVGGGVRERIRRALQSMCAKRAIPDEDASIQLLVDFRTLFAERTSGRVFTKEAAQWLAEREDRPWASWGRNGKPITPVAIAKRLADYQVYPKPMREGGRQKRGYAQEDFEQAWKRYLDPEGGPDPSQCHAASSDNGLGQNQPVTGDAARAQPVTAQADEGKGLTSECDGVTGGVADSGPGSSAGPRTSAPTPSEIVRRMEEDYRE